MKKKNEKNVKKYLALILMMFAMSTIYTLPYLRYSFFTALQDAMGLSNDATKYGNLMSVYGIMNLLMYLPGGIIADKFDSKKLLVFSMVGTGALGLWMATWPSYNGLLIIHLLFGITTVLTFWSSSVKVVNLLASSGEQGETFGFLESGRNVIGLALSAITLALFAYLSKKVNEVAGITFVIVLYSIIMILVGIVLYFMLPNFAKDPETTNASVKDSLIAMGKCFKMPITWCLSAFIFTCSVMTGSGSYYAPYLQEFCGMTVAAASTYAVVRTTVAPILAGPVAGKASKKFGRSTPVIMFGCIGLIITNILLRLVPGKTNVLFLIMVIMVLTAFSYSCNRSVYWATIDEVGAPKNVVGSITGIASMIGFLPDAFLGTLYGSWIDNFGMEIAYNKIFTFCVIVSVLGLFVALCGDRIIKKAQKTQKTIEKK